MPTGGPTLLGFDVIWIATILSGIATMAVMTAIYAATTVKDPMARRVKALNERREQLKAGIVASTNKRKKLTNRNQAADNVRQLLSQFKMLQEDQVKKTQIRLMQAGIRTKDLAFFLILARFVLPVVIGAVAVTMLYFLGFEPQWSALRRYMPSHHTSQPRPQAPSVGLSQSSSTKRMSCFSGSMPISTRLPR